MCMSELICLIWWQFQTCWISHQNFYVGLHVFFPRKLTAIAPKNRWVSKRNLLFQGSIFRFFLSQGNNLVTIIPTLAEFCPSNHMWIHMLSYVFLFLFRVFPCVSLIFPCLAHDMLDSGRALSGEGASLGVGVSVPYIYLIGNGIGSRTSTSNVSNDIKCGSNLKYDKHICFFSRLDAN